MEHIAALLLIVGCSDDLALCSELPAPTPIFETVEECEAELPYSMQKFMNDYPQIMANCVFVDPAMAEEDAELVWNVNGEGNLVASVESSNDVMVAGDARSDESGTARRE